MTSLRRLLAATVATTALLAGLTACGDNDKTDTSSASDAGDSAGSGTTTDSSSDDTDNTDDSDDSDDEDVSDSADSSDSSDSSDSDGAASPAGGAVFVDTTEPATTVTIGEAGAFEPSSVSVAVGDVVKFSCGEESGVYGIVVGDLDGYTVTKGIDEFFRFDKPGTYQVVEEISEAMMTVTVE